MSRIADELRQNRPDWEVIPKDLEHTWTWLEAHGFGLETPGGYYLVASRGDGPQIVFTAGVTLQGWLEPEAPGYLQLLPIAEASGDGAILALWRTDEAIRVVFLGSDGDTEIISNDVQGLLSLLAIGYDEIQPYVLGSEPEEPVDVVEYREWLTSECEISVPQMWPSLDDKSFSLWMENQLSMNPPDLV